jgi:hypothetical protein
MKLVSFFLIISGTYILSRNLFDSNIKMLINFFNSQTKLPFLIKTAILIFGYKNKIKDLKFWDVNYAPTREDFSIEKQLQIIQPFIGFIFILLGTLVSLYA